MEFVFDDGSGTGAFTRQLRPALPGVKRLVGIEPSRAMLAQAAGRDRLGESIVFVAGTAEAMPIQDKAAGAVVAATAAHWFNRPPFYRETRRVLTPGGVRRIRLSLHLPDGAPPSVVGARLAGQRRALCPSQIAIAARGLSGPSRRGELAYQFSPRPDAPCSIRACFARSPAAPAGMARQQRARHRLCDNRLTRRRASRSMSL